MYVSVHGKSPSGKKPFTSREKVQKEVRCYVKKVIKVLCYLQSEKNLSLCSTKLTHVCKNYHLHWIAGRANILSKYIIFMFFNFGSGLYGSFLILFPKAPASCCKKNLN